MKIKFLVLSALVICAVAAYTQVTNAPQVKNIPTARPATAPASPAPSTPSTPAVDNSKPEPSGVYGYVSIVDPNTGRRYIGDPHALPSQMGSGLTFPIHVVFRATNNPSQTFARDWPQGMAYFGNPPVAVWYSIGFVQDPAAGDYPVVNYRDVKLHYDPAKWRFVRVDMDPASWTETSDLGVSNRVSVPVSAVPAISTLPDFHGAPAGPGH